MVGADGGGMSGGRAVDSAIVARGKYLLDARWGVSAGEKIPQ